MAPEIKKCIKIHYQEMKPSKIESRHFVIPYKDREYIIYVPKRGLVALVNEDFVNGIKNNDKKVKSFFDYVDKQDAVPTLRSKYSTLTDFTLLLTNKCNMNCSYCYAQGGENSNCMSWEVAKTSLDYILRKNKNTFNLNFHGSGEPTLAFNLMKKSVDYAQKKCDEKKMNLNISCTTNGLINEKQVQWFSKNNVKVLLSFDGPSDIQNRQRPLKNGGGSYQRVRKTVDCFNKYGLDYATSSTFTKYGEGRLLEIVKHFKSLEIKTMVFRPCWPYGRAKDPLIPNIEKFVNEFIDCLNFTKEKDIHLIAFQENPYGLKSSPCEAAGEAFAVDSGGNIISCLLAADSNNKISKAFRFGKVDKDRVRINESKLKNLRKCSVHKMSKCKNCFCKYVCAGGCLYSNLSNNNSFLIPDNVYCNAVKKVIKYYLANLLTSKPYLGSSRLVTKDLTNIFN